MELTLGDGVVDDDSSASTSTWRVRTAAQWTARLADLDHHSVMMLALGRAVSTDARSTVVACKHRERQDVRLVMDWRGKARAIDFG